jgi:hypothetical protein
MIRALDNTARIANDGRTRHHPNGLPRRSRAAAKAGWTPERRARQSVLVARWQPWRRATGPRTDAGKARSSANALKHGLRSRAHLESLRQASKKRREIRRIISIAAHNIRIARIFLRARAAGQPQVIGPYVRALHAYMIGVHAIDGRR